VRISRMTRHNAELKSQLLRISQRNIQREY